MRVSHRPTLDSNYKEFCRVNFELLRVLYRPNLNSFTSFRIIESSADKTSNYCVFKISLSSARHSDGSTIDIQTSPCRFLAPLTLDRVVCNHGLRQMLLVDSDFHIMTINIYVQRNSILHVVVYRQTSPCRFLAPLILDRVVCNHGLRQMLLVDSDFHIMTINIYVQRNSILHVVVYRQTSPCRFLAPLTLDRVVCNHGLRQMLLVDSDFHIMTINIYVQRNSILHVVVYRQTSPCRFLAPLTLDRVVCNHGLRQMLLVDADFHIMTINI
ncbi:hypothetical protein J6590_050158 [Homalodisca vitripennis]|nr:hypothetical protein J6590_050158 [Homalodisca vitripennis]